MFIQLNMFTIFVKLNSFVANFKFTCDNVNGNDF